MPRLSTVPAYCRDTASPQPQRDLDGLLEPALSFAQQQLAQRGAFFPYAVVVRADGQTEIIAARPPGCRPRPTGSTCMVAACRTVLAEPRDLPRAAAVVADVRLPAGGD
ncbi:MAG: hypothetical protein QOH57_209 [Mycobacterium sp.]|jgi:hypothetical protein|nr:hypothetical protein [Mycobacterium sp.]